MVKNSKKNGDTRSYKQDFLKSEKKMKSERNKSNLLGMVMKTYCVFLVVFFAAVRPISAYGNLAKNPSMEGNVISQGSIGDVAASWTTGGPCGGYINSLAMAETNPDIIYAGTDNGAFKTVDGGDTWTRTGIPEILVRVVQVAPNNSDIIYAGTNDGVYKSEDGGNTWTQKGLDGAKWVNTIAIDPLNPDILYAGAGKPYSSYSGEIIGIFKSTDGGETWQEKLSEGLDAVVALLIDTNNSSYIYAGVNDGKLGFRKSTDGGETWVGRQVNSRGSFDYVVALAMTPAGYDPAVIYAFSFGYDDDVYKSMDRGESWTRTNLQPIDCGVSQRRLSLAVDPNDPHTIYVSNWCLKTPIGGVYKTSDGGETWSLKVNDLPQSVAFSIVIDPRNSDVLYIGLSEGGVYKSTDAAENWNISSQGISQTYIKGLAVDPTASDTVFATVTGIGVAKTTTGGASWDYLVGLPTNLGAVAIDPQNPSTIWVGDGYHYDNRFYVYKSTDGGQSWTSIEFLHFSPSSASTGVSDILINVDDSDCILVGTSGFDGVLARTTDGGLTWQQVGSSTTALAADPNNHDVVYVGKTRIGQVFRYPNVWGSWNSTEITPAEGIGGVRDIEVDSDSKVYVAASDGLWRWNGSGWTKLTGLPTDDITALAIDRFVSPGIIYVGTEEEGVFVSRDGGNTWTTFNEGLERLSVTKLAISASQPKILYAGIRYGGVWSTALDSGSYHSADTNRDYIINDFELLDYIDLWAQGQVGDFDLLDTIDLWAAGHYYWDPVDEKFKPGEEP
jgi:photosystem II stability/assembly factor-like uncharacterized protein